jgi:hypothetical protein
VTNIQAGQRTGTKLVDITYILALDPNESAFVELWFSPDNGLTYPVRCMAVTGHADANVSAGSKTVVWNAEDDWDHQFTSKGRIRVIATYGDHPSGFAGSGSNNGGGNTGGSGSVDASLKEVFWDVFYTPGGGGGGGGAGSYQDTTGIMDIAKMYVDKAEITNEKWNAIAAWGLSNGYQGLPMAPSTDATPRTGISFWDAIKWCNARSEMEGLRPAYYVDYSEAGHDENGNGVVDLGNGTPGNESFDYFQADTNGNGKWDPGEAIMNDDGDGIYEPKEYDDFNGNNQYDPGHTQVFRTGASITLPASGGGGGVSVQFSNCIDHNKSANAGYRLPNQPVFHKLATGGMSQKSWPWGDDSPVNHATFANEYVATLVDQYGPPQGTVRTAPLTVNSRPPNNYGLHDIIGNVAEWTESTAGTAGTGNVYGGSFLGLSAADEPDPGGGITNPVFSGANGSPASSNNLFELNLEGPQTASSAAIGMRSARYIWPN